MSIKINVKDLDKCQKHLQIEILKDTIQIEFDRYYEELKKTAQVPGFRKGKVPRNVLEEYFSGKAQEKVLSYLVSDNYQKAITQEKIDPVQLPQITNVDFKKNEKLTFEATVDIRPKINLKNYRGIKITKQRVDITEEEIAKVLAFLRERYAQFLPVEGRATKIGDYIICDYSYAAEGKTLEQKEHVWFEIAKELFIPGLSLQLVGVTAGEKKEFDLKLPDKFKPDEFAGKTAHFSFQVKEIKEKQLPELNDEFAKVVGKSSLEQLKEEVRRDLLREKETQVNLDVKRQLFEHLTRAMPIDVPASLVEKRKESLKNSSRDALKRQGWNEQKIKEEEDKSSDFFDREALKLVRILFILEEIGEKENIRVKEEEMEARIDSIAASYNQKREDLLKYLSENKLLENIHWEIWEDKITSFLIQNGKIEEVPAKKTGKNPK